MRVPVLMFANQAAVVDGLLNVQGGGWDVFRCPTFPNSMIGFVALLAELDPTELGEPVQLGFRLFGGEGQELGSHGSITILMNEASTSGGSAIRPVAFPFAVALEAPQTVSLAIEVANEEVARAVVSVITTS